MIDNQTAQDLSAMPSSATLGVRDVPLREATAEALCGYGRIVGPNEPWCVDIVPWPSTGRPVVPGTGVGGGTVTGSFDMVRQGGVLYAVNHAVRRRYITGWYGDPAAMNDETPPEDTTTILTHEANYHPDGGQIFFPRDGKSFVALLAKPRDDIAPDDFVAFHFDGSCGFHIDPGVWHQPLFPTGDVMTFDDEQGAVHACVGVDFVAEFGCYLRVPLAR